MHHYHHNHHLEHIKFSSLNHKAFLFFKNNNYPIGTLGDLGACNIDLETTVGKKPEIK